MMISKRSGNTRLKLNNEIYSGVVIEECVKRFSGVCRINKIKEKKDTIVEFSGLDSRDLEIVALEFSNYLLYLLGKQKQA